MTDTKLELMPPFEVGPAIAIIASQALPGSEVVDLAGARHTRLLSVPGEAPVAVTVELHQDHIGLRHRTLNSDAERVIAARVRQWLDLDADPAHILAGLGADRRIGSLVAARPGLRVIGLPEGFEGAVITILGQQVSLAAGRTFGARLVAAFGSMGDTGLRAFPGWELLASVSAADLQGAVGMTHARAKTLHGLSQAWSDGMRLAPGVDAASARQALLALSGVGPWTAETLAVRVIGDRDAYPAGDLVLRHALGGLSEAAARTAAANWSPLRSYALFHLWCSHLGI